MSSYDESVEAILATCKARRVQGAEQYGDESFYEKDNLNELKEELYDVINYAIFTLLQVEELQRKVALLNLNQKP